ncbi:MAG: hypothetical protein ACK5NG_06515, partial [Chthoniobacterales bacterium]
TQSTKNRPEEIRGGFFYAKQENGREVLTKFFGKTSPAEKQVGCTRFSSTQRSIPFSSIFGLQLTISG